MSGVVGVPPALTGWQEPPAGERCVNRIEALALRDGTPVMLSATVIRGVADGPTMYIGGGVHGDEVGATAIVQRAMMEIDPAQLSGRVICIPVQNPLAFEVGHRLALPLVQVSPMDQFPGDPWTQFPGAAGGNGAQAIAERLFAVMSSADVVVDVHTPTTGGSYVPFIFVPPRAVGAGAQRSLELAHAFGPSFILDAADGVYVQDGTPHVELARAGIPAFGFEVGEGSRAEPHCTATGWEGIRRLMHHLGMLAEPGPAAPPVRTVSSMTALRSDRGGILRWHAELGAEVRAGDVIADVTATWDPDARTEIVAPHDGPLMRITTFGAVAATDRIAQIGVEVR